MIYLTSISYEKTDEQGLTKKVVERYLVDAVSYTDAETRITSEMSAFVAGEFEVTDIRKQNVADIRISDDPADDRWYLVRIAFVTLDEKTLKEKRTVVRYYFAAADFDTACRRVSEYMHGTLGDYAVMSVSETNILDLFQ